MWMVGLSAIAMFLVGIAAPGYRWKTYVVLIGLLGLLGAVQRQTYTGDWIDFVIIGLVCGSGALSAGARIGRRINPNARDEVT